VEHSETIGRGLTLFVLFASTLNYMYYKELSENITQKNKKEKEKEKEKE
jgi:hypothetical protein